MKYGCAGNEEPVEIVDGLCVFSMTESLRSGGVGGMAVLWLLDILCCWYDALCRCSIATSCDCCFACCEAE